MKIFCKSTPDNYEKEKDNRKPNTVRVLDGEDIITIQNTETHEQFHRKIKDITTWNDIVIISWEEDFVEVKK